MKLNINKETTVESIQDAFRYTYPFLKVVFYTQDVTRNNHANGHRRLLTGNVVHMLADKSAYHFVDISKNRTVADVEADFETIGLQAQILRKSGTVWIETLLTRNWTLDLQNQGGEMLSQALATGAHTTSS